MKGFEQEVTKWRVIDGHWVNISRMFVNANKEVCERTFTGVLADYFFLLGIDIPDYITYAIIDTSDYIIKFRHFGGQISMVVRPNR